MRSISTATEIEESSNLSCRTPKALICVGIWLYPKLNAFISQTFGRLTP